MENRVRRISVTIRPDYRRALKTDGYHLRLFVYQNAHQRKCYSTNIYVTPEEWDKIKLGHPSSALREKRNLVIETQTKAQRIVRLLKDDFSFEEFEEHMFGITNKEKYDKTDVYATFQTKINLLLKENRIGSADVYKYVMHSFQSYRSNLKFHQINVPFLEKYERAMTERGLRKSSIGIRMKHLRAIVNMAKTDGIVSTMDYPFGRRIHHKYEIPTSKQPKKALSTRDMALIKNYDATGKDAWSRDIWLFCFYCNGMNFSDIFNLKWSNIDNDFIYFVRQKTKNMCRHEVPVEIFLTKEAKGIIDRWSVRSHNNNYIFGVFDDSMTAEEKLKANKFALRVINDDMNKIAKKLNIEKRITSFVARHTWATVLMQNGVPISYISKGLGHTSVQTTESYLADFEQDYKRDIGTILSNVTK